MTFNWEATGSHYFVDQENKMMLLQNQGWNPHGDNGAGDAVGRNKNAYFAYMDPRFVEGVKNCWTRVDCDPYMDDCAKWPHYYKGHRYPTAEYLTKDFSRDHTSNTFVLMKLAGEDEWLKEVTSNIRWVITDNHLDSHGNEMKHSFTLGLWGFAKSFAGKWWGGPLFYVSSFISVVLYNIINAFCYLMGWFSRELNQDDYNAKNMTRQQQSKWRQFWAGLTYPMYAASLLSWQLFVMKDNFMKRLLQYMMKPLIPRYNFMLKLTFNVGKVTKEDVMNYKPMAGGRWTTPLNEINDRDVHILTNKQRVEYNTLDKDMLIAMWNYRNPQDKI